MAATLALSAESFVGRAEMVTGSYEISTGTYVETLHGARTVPTAEGAHATNPRHGKRVNTDVLRGVSGDSQYTDIS